MERTGRFETDRKGCSINWRLGTIREGFLEQGEIFDVNAQIVSGITWPNQPRPRSTSPNQFFSVIHQTGRAPPPTTLHQPQPAPPPCSPPPRSTTSKTGLTSALHQPRSTSTPVPLRGWLSFGFRKVLDTQAPVFCSLFSRFQTPGTS